jgi:hypothetical protein
VDVTSVGDLTAKVDAANSETDPTARVQKLRDLRTNLAFLVGTCDRYIGDAELARESEAVQNVTGQLNARADADARDKLVNAGMIAPEAADGAGLWSHHQLDRQQELGESWMSELMGTGEVDLTKVRTLVDEDAILRGLAEYMAEGDDPPEEDGLNQPSTSDVYSRQLPDGQVLWDGSRRELHEQIVSEILAGVRRSEQPTAYLVGGVTDHDQVIGKVWQDHGRVPVIDQLAIRRLIPEFQRMLQDGDPVAHLAVIDEAHVIAQAALAEAISRRVDVAVTGLGLEPPIGVLKEAEYVIEAHYTTGTPILAIREAQDQAIDVSLPPDLRRELDPDHLIECFERLPEAIAVTDRLVDGLWVYNADGVFLKPIMYRLGEAEPVVVDEEAWQEAIRPTIPHETANEGAAP